MASAVYDNAMVHLGIGEVNWTLGQTDIYAALLGNTAPTKTHAHYSDLAGELSAANGYTAGGMVFPSLVTAALVSNVCQFDGGDCAFASLSKTAYYAVTMHGTLAGATDALLSYHDLGGAQTVTNGTLTLQWAATGVFTITITAQA